MLPVEPFLPEAGPSRTRSSHSLRSKQEDLAVVLSHVKADKVVLEEGPTQVHHNDEGLFESECFYKWAFL